MGIETGGPGDLASKGEQEALFEAPVPTHEAETQAVIERAAANGAAAAARRVAAETSARRGELEVIDPSEARRDQTSPAIWRTESVVDLEDAKKRSEAAAAEVVHQERLAVRDAEAAKQAEINQRSKPDLGIETQAQRTIREASERQATARAAADADPSIREADQALGAEMARRARFEQDRIQTRDQAIEAADKLRQTRRDVDQAS